jgi:hypothetical protein
MRNAFSIGIGAAALSPRPLVEQAAPAAVRPMPHDEAVAGREPRLTAAPTDRPNRDDGEPPTA